MIIIFYVLVFVILLIVGIRRFLREEVFVSKFDSENINLNYKKFGNGSKKLILIHGLLASSR